MPIKTFFLIMIFFFFLQAFSRKDLQWISFFLIRSHLMHFPGTLRLFQWFILKKKRPKKSLMKKNVKFIITITKYYWSLYDVEILNIFFQNKSLIHFLSHRWSDVSVLCKLSPVTSCDCLISDANSITGRAHRWSYINNKPKHTHCNHAVWRVSVRFNSFTGGTGYKRLLILRLGV